MRRSIRSARSVRSAAVAAMVCTGLVFGLGACSDISDAAKGEVDKAVDKAVNETYEVTYEVTGKNIDSIEFTAGGESAAKPKTETVKKPQLPWKKTVTLRGIMPPSVVPVALDAAGDAEITCKIVHKGKAIAEQSGKGLAAAAGCVAVSPII